MNLVQTDNRNSFDLFNSLPPSSNVIGRFRLKINNSASLRFFYFSWWGKVPATQPRFSVFNIPLKKWMSARLTSLLLYLLSLSAYTIARVLSDFFLSLHLLSVLRILRGELSCFIYHRMAFNSIVLERQWRL